MAYMASKPEEASTLSEFIALGRNTKITYNNLSILDKITVGDGGIYIPTKNIIYDYLDELKKLSQTVLLTDTDYIKYVYKPRLLSYDVYGTTELYFLILALNNIYDIRQFTIDTKKVQMLTVSDYQTVINYIYNSEKSYIDSNRASLGI